MLRLASARGLYRSALGRSLSYSRVSTAAQQTQQPLLGSKTDAKACFCRRESVYASTFASSAAREARAGCAFSASPSRLNGAALDTPKELGDRLLTDQQHLVVEKEKIALKNLLATLEKLDASKEDIDLLSTCVSQLNGLFMLVVVGEFNSGKSSFLNAMLGTKHLEEGVTPTTSRIHVIRHGNNTDVTIDTINKDLGYVRVPVDWLKEIQLVDTPGTNAIIRSHQQITEHFIPQSDMILFVTSCDRAFSESERLFLEKIEQWNKKVVVILSKVDILDNESEVTQVHEFVRENFKKALGVEPTIFTISSKQALNRKLAGDSAGSVSPRGDHLSHLNHFSDLEEYILRTLDPQVRAKLKLENPLNVSRRLVMQYRTALDQRIDLLKGDVQSLDDVLAEVNLFTDDMKKDFLLQRNRIDSTMIKLEQRGEAYLDKTLRLGNLAGLSNESQLREDFEKKVIGETTHDIDQLISEIIDWMVEKNSKQWSHIMALLNARSQHNTGAGRSSNQQFEYNRKHLLNVIGTNVSHTISGLDKETEALRFAGSVKSALFQTVALTGAGALGFGALLSASLLDFTGIIGLSVIAVGGLCIIPYKKRIVKNEFMEKVEDLRQKLLTTTTEHFYNEMDVSSAKVIEAMGPYSTFVRTEQTKLKELDTELKAQDKVFTALHEEITDAWAK